MARGLHTPLPDVLAMTVPELSEWARTLTRLLSAPDPGKR